MTGTKLKSGSTDDADRPSGGRWSSMSAPRSAGSLSVQDLYARLEVLNELLLTEASATIVLERWCGAGHVVGDVVTVERVMENARPSGKPAVLPATGGVVRHRRVRLRYADCILSEAENWYHPGSLTPEMNELLDTSDISFGRIVQPLGFRRRTISAEMLWHPEFPFSSLPGSSADVRTIDAELPAHVLRHRAVLILPNGAPFSEVVETYGRAVLTFEPRSAQA